MDVGIAAIRAYLLGRRDALRDEYMRLLRENVPFYRALPEDRLRAALEAFWSAFLDDSLPALAPEPTITWAANSLRGRVQHGLPLEGALKLNAYFRRTILLTLDPLLEAREEGVLRFLLFVDEVSEKIVEHIVTLYTGEIERAQEALRQAAVQEETIRAQEATLRELSTPLIPVSDDVLVMPIVGLVDRVRAEQMRQALLDGIAGAGAKVAILDVTGVPAMDAGVAGALLSAVSAARLLGAEVVLTGIKPAAARALVELGVNFERIVTRGTLKDGIAHALAREKAR